MASSFTSTLLAAGFGWVAGMRSASAPALLANGLSTPAWRYRRPARFLARYPRLLGVAAAGEYVMDKLPTTPARTAPPVLGGRILSGMLTGAAVAAARRTSILPAALAGGLTAVASSYVMMNARLSLGRTLNVPDFPIAVVEDVLTVGLGNALARAV